MPQAASICAIIPTYNRAHMLPDCINSLLAQSRPLQEIIVVNDGSTDDTESVIKSYGTRLTYFRKNNGGKASALNLALAHCTSDYIWICDDDDIAAPDGVEHLAAALDADDTLGFVFGTYKEFRDDASGRHFSDPGLKLFDGETDIKLLFLEGMIGNQFGVLVRRSLYEKAGPFREDLIRSQDYDMMLRLSRFAKAAYVPKIVYFYRMHAGIRGSATDSFLPEKNSQKWAAYNQKIFTRIRQEYRIEEFTPTFALQWDPVLAKRAALVQRACVYARRAMWDYAIDDFHTASDISADPPTPEELRLAERFMLYAPPWGLIHYDCAWAFMIQACYQANRYGRTMILATCRPLIWQMRYWFQKKNYSEVIQTLRTLIHIVGIRGACSRAMLSLLH